MRFSRYPAELICALVALSSGFSTHIQAKDSVALEEVIVTAQRRAQSLGDVSVSVSVVDGKTLLDVGARDISEIAAFAPNISFDNMQTQTGGSITSSVYIRGIGQSDFLQTTDPGVGLFVDGVYVARAVGSLLDVADVERIEVLRGPQGTLFGRNTVGGAINVISRAPQDERAVTMRATLGSDERLDSFVRLDAPFGENLRSKLSFATFDQDGYVYRPGAGDWQGSRHSRAAHAQIVYTPGERITLKFSGDYTRTGDGGAPATLKRVVQVCPAGVMTAVGGCDGNFTPGAPVSQTYLFNNVAPVNLAAGGAGVGVSVYDERYVPTDPYINYGTGQEATRLDLWGASLTFDWKLAAFSLRSISAWRTFDTYLIRDTDAAPYDVFAASTAVQQRQISQEIQFLSPENATRLEWLAGLYFLDEQADDDAEVHAAAVDLQSGGRDIINRSYAAFGQATYRFNKTVGLTLGARYTEERKSYIPTQYFLGSVTGMPPAGLTVIPSTKNELEFSKPTYRAAVEVHSDENTLLYASWSTGFKNGGFVQRNQVPRPLLPTFGPETVEVLEIGAKSTLLDSRLRLGFAVFASDYEDLQIRVVEPNSVTVVTSNAGDARIRGGEFEFEAVPHARLRLSGGIGYLDGKYVRIATTAPDIRLDSKLTDSPEWSANLSVTGSITQSLSARIDWTYRASSFNDAENTPDLWQEAFSLLNASATWRMAFGGSHDVSATLGVRNATDERFLISGFALAIHGPVAASYARPREWFMTIGLAL